MVDVISFTKIRKNAIFVLITLSGMKRILLVVTLLFATMLCFAQQKTAKVTMKNGTTITGSVVDFNPTSHITISIAGFKTEISMSEVLSVEEVASNQNLASMPSSANGNDNYAVVDDYPYPETYNLKIGPYDVKMLLVKGTTFSMGYDGNGSRAMDSEPVHDVTLTSYYVNAQPLSKDVVSYIKKGKENHSDTETGYHATSRRDAQQIVESIAEITKLPVTLITEAQWEYAAIHQSGVFDFSKEEWNYCYDYYGSYSRNKTPEIDPTGPQAGNSYVIRLITKEPNQAHCRRETLMSGASTLYRIRISFSASAIKEKAHAQ